MRLLKLIIFGLVYWLAYWIIIYDILLPYAGNILIGLQAMGYFLNVLIWFWFVMHRGSIIFPLKYDIKYVKLTSDKFLSNVLIGNFSGGISIFLVMIVGDVSLPVIRGDYISLSLYTLGGVIMGGIGGGLLKILVKDN